MSLAMLPVLGFALRSDASRGEQLRSMNSVTTTLAVDNDIRLLPMHPSPSARYGAPNNNRGLMM